MINSPLLPIQQLTVANWKGGSLYATKVGSFTVSKRMDAVTVVVAGNLDKGKVGTFGSGSVVAVGVNPGAGGYFDGDETGTGGTLGSFVVGAYDKTGTAPFGIVTNTLGRGGLKLAGRTLKASALPFTDGQFCVRIVT
jgi:hypothetical protein